MTRANRAKIHENLKTEWETPPELFDKLDREFAFNLDAAASKHNALVTPFLSIEDNALECSWECPGPSTRVFLNPPYGHGLARWVTKARYEARVREAMTVVCLLPANTEQEWFHCALADGEIRFIRRRVQFLLNSERTGKSNPGANLIAIFGEMAVRGRVSSLEV